LHMIQVFLWGAHKYPRELTWIVGVFLFLCTLGMAFTGQILRWDQDAYWGLGIGASIASRAPGVGDVLVQLLLARPLIALPTLTCSSFSASSPEGSASCSGSFFASASTNGRCRVAW